MALSKSEGSGTCVLTTKCAGVDTSAFEFAFLCVDEKGTEVRARAEREYSVLYVAQFKTPGYKSALYAPYKTL